MAFFHVEDFVGNGALKGILPKLLEEGWDNVRNLKLMKSEDMDAINMTQQQKDALEMRSYLHDRALLQYGDKIEASGKSLPELLGLTSDDLSSQFGMKRGHIASFMEKRTSTTCELQPPLAFPSSRKTATLSARYNRINNGCCERQEPNNSKESHSLVKSFIAVTMDRSLYEAAMEGKVDVLMEHIDQLNVQVTSNDNTVLHVTVQFGNLECVKKILDKCPMLLRRVNIKSETPLHIAAREKHFDIANALIDCATELNQEPESGGGATKEILRATNEDKDTALHMAVRNGHLDMVKLLTREDPQFSHPANNAEETPLYLAAEKRDGAADDLVVAILDNCTSPGYSGPSGRTALHAAAIRDHRHSDIHCMRRLLDWKQDLIKEADEYGWTPLHYATRSGNLKGVKQLLEKDKSVAYITTADNDDGKIALHIAATTNDVKAMKEILSYCPDCWEIVNGKGRNILHIAVDMEKEDAIKFMKEKSWFSHLKKQKDIEGNTPHHLLIAALWKVNSERDIEVNFDTFNNKNMTPGDIRWSAFHENFYKSLNRPISRPFSQPFGGGGRNIVQGDQDYVLKWKARGERKEAREEQVKERTKERVKSNNERAQTHLIVATLIATVTFAASFTMPGGYDSNQGTPILLRQTTFKAFVITNTIAMICSISAGFLYASASFYKEVKKQQHRHLTAFWLILIAMGAMVLAFITGTYTTLLHSLGIAIAICVVGSFSFFILIPEVIQLYKNYYIRDLDFAYIWEEVRIHQPSG